MYCNDLLLIGTRYSYLSFRRCVHRTSDLSWPFVAVAVVAGYPYLSTFISRNVPVSSKPCTCYGEVGVPRTTTPFINSESLLALESPSRHGDEQNDALPHALSVNYKDRSVDVVDTECMRSRTEWRYAGACKYYKIISESSLGL